MIDSPFETLFQKSITAACMRIQERRIERLKRRMYATPSRCFWRKKFFAVLITRMTVRLDSLFDETDGHWAGRMMQPYNPNDPQHRDFINYILRQRERRAPT